ncbi:hypothetical protein AB1Y20_010626 [Prymnesium parvum]|uniref:Uncharacterized protein n=1 Tax=Prymnesium parvum TaxID=97485 RepID=A0AB34IQ81_PRYPA|mmetsp:Transcript_13332/g.28227  ORF Transcript_13332/g.28227 Transcript_13332/m.28227 type:complete len:96 (-) Transcript_13332:35-322(-)
MQAVREGLLAMATGAAAGGAASFLVLRQVWLRAQHQGDLCDAAADSLRTARGESSQLQQPRMEIPSLYELRLRRELMNAWNEQVWYAYNVLKRWA